MGVGDERGGRREWVEGKGEEGRREVRRGGTDEHGDDADEHHWISAARNNPSSAKHTIFSLHFQKHCVFTEFVEFCEYRIANTLF